MGETKYDPCGAHFNKARNIAFVGFAGYGRLEIPWEDPNFEIWGLNEEYSFDWMKRWDRWFQLHPKWNYLRGNNHNDPNHPAWLHNQQQTCKRCLGKGYLWNIYLGEQAEEIPEKDRKPCFYCDSTGHYDPRRFHRDHTFPIYLYPEPDPEIPGSTKYPLEEIIAATGNDYFTSSFAYLSGLASLLYKQGKIDEVHTFGFVMASETEWKYQRPGGEFWIGYMRGIGIKVVLHPDTNPLTKGLKYGIEQLPMMYKDTILARISELATTERELAEYRETLDPLSQEYMVTTARLNVISGARQEAILWAQWVKKSGTDEQGLGRQELERRRMELGKGERNCVGQLNAAMGAHQELIKIRELDSKKGRNRYLSEKLTELQRALPELVGRANVMIGAKQEVEGWLGKIDMKDLTSLAPDAKVPPQERGLDYGFKTQMMVLRSDGTYNEQPKEEEEPEPSAG